MNTIRELVRKIFVHNLARNSAIVFAGSMAANVGSYVYHLLMGRLLGPAGYGEYSSLLSLLYIFTVPLTVSQTVLIKFVSDFKAHGEIGQAKSLFTKVTKMLLVAIVIGFPFAFIAAPWIAGFLHLTTSTLFIVLYALGAFSFLSVPPISLLSGYQRFIWLSIFSAGGIFLKLAISIPMARWGVYGVLLGATMSSLIVYTLYYIPLRFILRIKSAATNLSRTSAFGYAVPTLFTLLGITSLFSTDIILVKHFFQASEAGIYAALAILGKIVFYASSAIATVLFPTVAERAASSGSTKKLILAATGGVASISAGITILYFLFPDSIIRLLFGKAYGGAGVLLGEFGVFITLFSVGYIITMASLAIGKTRIWIVPAACAILQIIGISLIHNSISDVLFINITVSAVFMIAAGLYYLKISHEKV